MFGSADDFHAPLQTLFIMISNVTNIMLEIGGKVQSIEHLFD